MESLLRDIDREHSKALDALTKFNQRYDNLQDYLYQYVKQSVIEWAKLCLTHPKAVLMIVETTPVVDERGYRHSGYQENEPIRIAVYQLVTKKIILDQFIYPTYSTKVEGQEYHAITLEAIEGYAGQTKLGDVWPDIEKLLSDKIIIMFGRDWAKNAITGVVRTSLLNDAFDLHNKCREYYRQFYELGLSVILKNQAIDKTREQLKSSQARLVALAEVLENLAKGKETTPEPKTEEIEIDDHPF